jgi:hypothetical protein
VGIIISKYGRQSPGAIVYEYYVYKVGLQSEETIPSGSQFGGRERFNPR